jgi:beta-galactosidase
MGSPRWISAGQIGGALALDGMEDYVNCGVDASLDIADVITLSAWVKTNDAGDGQHNPYLAKGDTSYAIKGHANNSVEFFIYDGDWFVAQWPYDSSFNGVWHHVAGTYDGIQLKLYIDGALRSVSDYIGYIASNQYAVNIGRNSEADDGTRFYEGAIDDVRIYTRALSSAEIAYLADTTPSDGQLYVPIPSFAELYSSESAGSRRIDFKDYAELASAWLEQSVWP